MSDFHFITYKAGDFSYWFATEKEFSSDPFARRAGKKRVLTPEQQAAKAARKAARDQAREEERKKMRSALAEVKNDSNCASMIDGDGIWLRSVPG